MLERTQFEPFGAAIGRTIQGVGYTGHVMDAATGLTYMQQHYYDPSIGRFLSVDPVTANGSTGGNFNRYWYANNNPYRFKDPDGRFGIPGACGGTLCDSYRKAGCEATCVQAGASSKAKPREKTSSDSKAAATATTVALPMPQSGSAGGRSLLGGLLSRLRGGVWALPLALTGDTRKQDGINLYRVVGPAEQAGIAATSSYSLAPNGFMVKQFWTSRGDAQLFARAEAANLGMGSTERFIVTSWVSNDTVRMGDSLWLDGMSALSFDAGALGAVNADAGRSGGIRTVETLEPSD